MRTDRRNRGIALRIALLSWGVALATLCIFVLVTVPQQKKIFLDNLASKANTVAVALYDVAAGAAINEDYASVVSAAQTMLDGDPDVEFLAVIKSDGFSLFMTQSGWKMETQADTFWLPPNRVPTGKIVTVPLGERRAFHYAQPFNYSGIYWGWIHVGLSLKDYDTSVTTLYRNTVLLALGCALFSLLVSLLYARHMVKPILRLRHLVEQIAEGDLSVRADRVGHDEVGSLAASVNTMTDALLQRDHILESVRFAAEQFVRTSKWQDAITDVLAKIGRAADVSRAYIFENHLDNAGRLSCSLRYEWVAQGIRSELTNPDLQDFVYVDAGFDRWIKVLGRNELLFGSVSEMSAGERAVLEPQGILSLLIIPVVVAGEWWGFLGLDECVRDRVWTDAEKDSLQAAAEILGATISRQRIQQALLEAKNTLEQRVEQRTHELQAQVVAKERALTELAAAQSSLLEMSRAAGMAEVATGVLHNVGNVLNSINVSCTLLMDQLRQSRIGNVGKIADLMAQAGGELARFVSQDPRGRQIPAYLTSLAATLDEEQQVMRQETELLQSRIEHIKEIIFMQQSYGRVSGVNETIAPEKIMEDALAFHADALARHRITVERRYASTDPITVDKHAVLQILLNLISNAKYACTDKNDKEKIVTLRVIQEGADRIRMEVTDNGMGISMENLPRIFQHGFTTRKTGHGFGLHSGALAARQLGGSLRAHSEGPGTGATFTLELPCHPGESE